MNLLLRQIWALIRKNLLLIIVRRPIYTFIRSLAIPIAIVLIVAYSKNFFSSPQQWGVSSPHRIRSLRQGLDASESHNIVGFIDNGMKGGQVSSVINSLSQQISDAGKTPKLYNSSWDLAKECRTDDRGVSPCYGAIIFESSPTEEYENTTKGAWNYTMRGAGAVWNGYADVRSNTNGPEIDLLPLQRSLDMAIISQSKSNNASQLPTDMDVILFTDQDQAVLENSKTSNYLSLCIFVFGPIFALAMVDIIYHMVSFIARERELGMSGLIDTMISGGSNFRGRIVRQVANYVSFALVYLPSWLAIGIILSIVIFPNTSHNIPIAFVVLSGLAITSFSLFGSSFFKRAQLSGSIMVLIAVVGAILAAAVSKQTQITVGILSLLFPTANFTYFITGVATFEAANKPIDMMRRANEEDNNMKFRLPLYIHWIFLGVHILVFPILAFFIEHMLFSTASPHRKFARPASPEDPTVSLSGFHKTYHPAFFSRIFGRQKDVHAVVGLDLKAFHGQILCLLGPNGSGKSTTLNCIAGDQKVTSGEITIDPSGGLGYAPQQNVIWPELTVREHITIFSDLKCLAAVNDEAVNSLAKGVDLLKKLPAQAKTLSGGQKRKLQMAMMFAGGSAVCCVDEVSTGLDPISRRRIWEILLAERGRRTIIMTTHFLDEADYLADDVAIMYKGSLRASGTAATLKNRFGDGYTIKLPSSTDIDMSISAAVVTEHSRHQTVYRVATAALAVEVVEKLEQQHQKNYQLSGPTMEELFLKVTGDTIAATEELSDPAVTQAKDHQALVTVAEGGYELAEGQPISAFNQWWILLCKRVRICKRRWIPYFVAFAFAIVGAAVAPLLIKSFNRPTECPVPAELILDYNYRIDFGTIYSPDYLYGEQRVYVFGPASKLDESRLDVMADVYAVKYTTKYGHSTFGYSNGAEIKAQLLMVDTFEEFSDAVKANWRELSQQNPDIDYMPPTSLRGGIWIGDENSKPTVMVNVRQADEVSRILNFFDVVMSGVPISSSYYKFATIDIPLLYDFKALMFIVYYGLIMACYPVFFALYPTNERISNVRSMQYSNGIRPIPLWLSHLTFDGAFVLIISIIATGLLSASTPVWHGLGFVFLILFLYGIVCALLSYIISMFARTAVTAWFLMAIGQVIFYFAYFGGLIGVQSSVPYDELESTMNSLYFGLGVISPVVSLEKALLVGLQQFAFLCNGHGSGSIYLYGGPIMYLTLQAVFLFVLLLWWDNGFILPSLRSHTPVNDPEGIEMSSADLVTERKRLVSSTTDLRVNSVTKSFGKNLAVDNVTFGVQTSEMFALLGPNGAGKSTIISMIRGDIKPSTPNSAIDIAGHSILSHPVAARANLGVCPQFDSADVLTVKETLRFFAKIRGVKHIEHNVSTLIDACGLEAWADQLAQNLSGGTKRKLSLAVALVGNPRVLILDEPSSALDANAKRNLWRCLQTMSKNRAIVLTTHSMEEADALADRIGIVSSRMLAVGNREDIKNRAGDAFHIHLVSRSSPRTTPQELQTMKDWISQEFPQAKISRETQGGQIRFEVPAEGRELVWLISRLEGAKERLGVEFYSVGKATLDEVFENIVNKYRGEDGIEG